MKGSSPLRWPRGRALLTIPLVQTALAIPALPIDSCTEYGDLIWGSTMQPAGGAIALPAFT